MSPDLDQSLEWMRQGEALATAAIERLADGDLKGPSLLPDWTRAHVVGHLARNAEALGRLAAWARTGVPTPMYADSAQRAVDIDAASVLPADVLRREAVTATAALDAALAALDADTWRADVRSALGRTIPATEIPWLRTRETWLHAIDLNSGTTTESIPGDLVDALLDDIVAALSARPDCPALLLLAPDRDRSWNLGRATSPIGEVRGVGHELLGWLAGRTSGNALTRVGERPSPPRWI
jgi:maleylpyruvate isomerase